jgi:endoglucanase
MMRPRHDRCLLIGLLLLTAFGCSAGGEGSPPDLPSAPDGVAHDTSPVVLGLHTAGRYIVDGDGQRVRLRGINWNGAHEEKFVPLGLDFHAPDEIAARIAELGFNSVRLTYSDEMVATDPIPAPETVAGAPALTGRSAMEVFDATVAALTAQGLYVILNNHMSDAAWCCSLEDGNALWYNERWSEAQWIDNWVSLAKRYAGNPLVVGADLRNEPRLPTLWSAAAIPEVDWSSAAERCAEAVLAERPDWLIVVEGVHFAADLSGVADRPIQLSVPNRLVYSAHDYSWFLPAKEADQAGYAALIDERWGYLLDPPYEVPVWISEFGTCNSCLDEPWWSWFGAYVTAQDLDWCLWLLFGSPDGWGLLDPESLELNNPVFLEDLMSW